MRRSVFLSLRCGSLALALAACSKESAPASGGADPAVAQAGQASVRDDDSQKDIVKVAVGSKDHTTLVQALQAAGLVDAMANAGPFTVFAPTNAAFAKLPAGTVENLLKPENREQLRLVLQHHVTVTAIEAESLTDGQVLGMVDGKNATVSRRGADLYVGDAKVIASVRASNGMVHVVDGVILAK